MNNVCSVQEETIHLYLDKALSPAEREAFITHLEQCSSCQTRLVHLQTLFADLSSVEDIDPPLDLASQVMAALPEPVTPSRPMTFGRVVLVAQIIVGLLIILVTWPVIASTLTSYPVQQSVLTTSQIILSLNNWLTDLIMGLNSQISTQWPPTAPASGLDISPGVIVILVAGFGLAWLIGNGILLRHPSSFKNGGAS